ncbi:MAG: DNA-binding protein [Candidatus Abyssobacteria bacterium SURF_17]|uniref:DNA-binding protein n=1 Tax=Candidatus Abyssobacteria bacterium SURF_17 TaxID=2093361 RepID=A0A419EU44_9BACT|nr:MAG: DNA-binding protein [Candidatus Abyssubacteria bacterium SURF_17]
MKFSQGEIGRVFVMRLEDGDKLPQTIEDFAAQQGVSSAMCVLVGGIDDGGTIVVGPRDRTTMPPEPMLFKLKGVHEVSAVGTLFPDAQGRPRLHMHAALGREGNTHTGCIRPGVDIWKLGEVVLLEILNSTAVRRKDPATGFEVLVPQP